MANNFEWVDFYMKFADKLLSYKGARNDLIQKIKQAHENIKPDKHVSKFENDIDPFTVFGSFNRGLGEENRIKFVKNIGTVFEVDAKSPDTFDGIPVLNNMNSLFYDNEEHDIDNLWTLFASALEYSNNETETNRQNFIQAYDLVRERKGISWNITMGLFWIRPNTYINFDETNREYMKDPKNVPSEISDAISALKGDHKAEEYLKLRDRIKEVCDSGKYPYHSFPELSCKAWNSSKEKGGKEPEIKDTKDEEKGNKEIERYTQMLKSSMNVILHGAPGTGKTYLAKQIAAEIVSEGNTQDYGKLNEDQKKQIEFVQFHPSYDYTDFVEGLRPRSDDAGNDGTIGFELRDGIFKSFADRARENYENSPNSKDNKSEDIRKKERIVKESIEKFFSEIEFSKDIFKTKKGTKFTVTGVDEGHIYLFIPENLQVNKLTLKIGEIRRMLESDTKFENVKDLTKFFGKQYATQGYSYDLALYKEIKKHTTKAGAPSVQPEKLKNYVFIIDEINRGEISKIFGELFFSIDPGYRGESGAVSTQYSSLHDDPDKKFYIPENVYIIGTMNDIDRSVDTFDFAMRRRFRFVEISAKDSQAMLDGLDEDIRNEAIKRMDSLNAAIKDTEDLNENYQIGAAYFLRLEKLKNDFDALWNDYLEPLLREYVRGMRGEDEKMNEFEKAYKHVEGNSDGNDEETSEDQGQ